MAEQPCWTCMRSLPGRGCEWADKLIPVKGWKAVPTVKSSAKRYGNRPLCSFRISYCPKYVKEEEKK